MNCGLLSISEEANSVSLKGTVFQCVCVGGGGGDCSENAERPLNHFEYMHGSLSQDGSQ